MVLLKVSARIETERETVYCISKRCDKLFHHVSYGEIHSANSQPFGDWDAKENETEKGREG